MSDSAAEPGTPLPDVLQALNRAIYAQWRALHQAGLRLPPPFYLDYPLAADAPLFVGLHPPRDAAGSEDFHPAQHTPPAHYRARPAWLAETERPAVNALHYIGQRAAAPWGWVPALPMPSDDSAAVRTLFRDWAPRLAEAHLRGLTRLLAAYQPPGAVVLHEYLRDSLPAITQSPAEFYVNFEYKVYGALKPAAPRYPTFMNISYLAPEAGGLVPILGSPQIEDPPPHRALVVRCDNKTNVNCIGGKTKSTPCPKKLNTFIRCLSGCYKYFICTIVANPNQHLFALSS